jgi:hypothetical protein
MQLAGCWVLDCGNPDVSAMVKFRGTSPVIAEAIWSYLRRDMDAGCRMLETEDCHG